MCSAYMIILSKEHYLGEGEQKQVFLHPDDEGLCIKFAKKDKRRKAGGLKREIRYTKKFQGVLEFLAKYRGELETNMGKGHLFDLIRNSNGEISATLSSSFRELDQNVLVGKIREIYQTLLKEGAVVSDLHVSNILVQLLGNSDYKLVLIDGFGNSDLIKICDYSRVFLKHKLDRKFTKLCKQMSINAELVIS